MNWSLVLNFREPEFRVGQRLAPPGFSYCLLPRRQCLIFYPLDAQNRVLVSCSVNK